MKHRRRALPYGGCVVILAMVALASLSLWRPIAPEASWSGPVRLEARLTKRQATLGPANAQRLLENYARTPLRFEAWPEHSRKDNQGRSAGQEKFAARGSGYSVLLTPTEAVLGLYKGKEKEERGRNGGASFGLLPTAASAQQGGFRSEGAAVSTEAPETGVVRMKLVGANAAARVVGRDPLPGRVNYYLGNDPKQWRTNVRGYAKVQYEGVYPGVDLVYYGNQGQLEYDFVVAPGADPGAIRLRFEGADKVEVDAQGDLALHTVGGPIHLRKPVVYQQVKGARREIAGSYVLNGAREASFKVAAYDPRQPLVIDPVLTYSTYLGGSDFDSGFGIAVDAEGNMYVGGNITKSVDFPTENAFQPEHHGGPNFLDTFVTKFDPSGQTLIYSTYLGGSGDDTGRGPAVDTQGNAYVTGWTTSRDFPTVKPFQAMLRGPTNAFVTKFDADGGVVYSTYLGGRDGDAGGGIAVDAEGNAYVTGNTFSADFPTVEPFQPTLRGRQNAFVTKLDATGSALLYSTYFGGSRDDGGHGIAVDGEGNIYLIGDTFSRDFPTANAFQPAYGGGPEDAFVTKFDASGQTLIYSTYLGGTDEDDGAGIAVDAVGNSYVIGSTFSRDFPTVNPIQPDFAGGPTDAFVTKFDADGSVVYSTYLGGREFDAGRAIAVDAEGNAYVAGETISPNFPTENPLQPALTGFINAFVAEFDASGTTLLFSTYLGGSVADRGRGIAVDASGNIYVTGETLSPDFPLQNPFQDALRGQQYDAFVSRISPDSSPR